MDRDIQHRAIRRDVQWVRKSPMELCSSCPGADFTASDTTVVSAKQPDLLVSNELPLGL